MSTFAAVMTGKGTGAIATVQVFGESAETVLKDIFMPAGERPPAFEPGKILVGTIRDAAETVDQVTIGCEGPKNLAVNCHGNPLIVESIMRLLQRYSVTPVTAEELRLRIVSAEGPANSITLEAKLALPQAKTLEGTKIIANQIDAGLADTVGQWLDTINETSLDQIQNAAAAILQIGPAAKLIIEGCTAVITGPANSGKSTLLNRLCGTQKAIVTDIKGTTRDWVGAHCRIDSLYVEFIDTAGLDAELALTEGEIEKASRQTTVETLSRADLVLLVLDGSDTAKQVDQSLLEKIAGRKILTILNKSDLPAELDPAELPKILSETVRLSAKTGDGIENLLEKLRHVCGVVGYDFQRPVAFTARQQNLLKQLIRAKSKDNARSIITELLNGTVSV